MNVYKMCFFILMTNIALLILASQVLPQNTEINLDTLKNLTYTIHPSLDRPMKVKLVNGRYNRRNLPFDFVMTSLHQTASGDLNNDGKPDAGCSLGSPFYFLNRS